MKGKPIEKIIVVSTEKIKYGIQGAFGRKLLQQAESYRDDISSDRLKGHSFQDAELSGR